MFYWKGSSPAPKTFNPDDDNWVEIWNDVFMEYVKTKAGVYEKANQKNVDNGRGLERIMAVVNGYEDNYRTSIFQPIITEIEKLSNKTYGKKKEDTRAMRIIADHVRAATFIIGDQRGVKPSNVGQGYVVRRLIRRAVRYGKKIGIQGGFTSHIAKIILPLYPDYQELHTNKGSIIKELDEEEAKFNKTLEQGLKKFQELAKMHKKIIPGNDAFLLFQSYGFPIEMTQELAQEQGVTVDLEEYNTEFQKHQDLSRTASAGMFKSGLADDSKATRKLHTATHLLNEALRQIVSKDIKQKGSNITPERLRFDFNFPRKLTDKEIQAVEALVNKKIQAGLIMHREEVPLADAVSSGAQHEFGGKYPEMVSIYTAIDPQDPRSWFAKEFCTGPHVHNTRELGSFKIIKEEAVAAGIRRIKAIIN
jgi:alanyl-tRNA synthetase